MSQTYWMMGPVEQDASNRQTHEFCFVALKHALTGGTGTVVVVVGMEDVVDEVEDVVTGTVVVEVVGLVVVDVVGTVVVGMVVVLVGVTLVVLAGALVVLELARAEVVVDGGAVVVDELPATIVVVGGADPGALVDASPPLVATTTPVAPAAPTPAMTAAVPSPTPPPTPELTPAALMNPAMPAAWNPGGRAVIPAFVAPTTIPGFCPV
jgi:hypothetical protein